MLLKRERVSVLKLRRQHFRAKKEIMLKKIKKRA
jgi:hypothetical protein